MPSKVNPDHIAVQDRHPVLKRVVNEQETSVPVGVKDHPCGKIFAPTKGLPMGPAELKEG
jgi:hypothetical protein